MGACATQTRLKGRSVRGAASDILRWNSRDSIAPECRHRRSMPPRRRRQHMGRPENPVHGGARSRDRVCPTHNEVAPPGVGNDESTPMTALFGKQSLRTGRGCDKLNKGIGWNLCQSSNALLKYDRPSRTCVSIRCAMKSCMHALSFHHDQSHECSRIVLRRDGSSCQGPTRGADRHERGPNMCSEELVRP